VGAVFACRLYHTPPPHLQTHAPLPCCCATRQRHAGGRYAEYKLCCRRGALTPSSRLPLYILPSARAHLPHSSTPPAHRTPSTAQHAHTYLCRQTQRLCHLRSAPRCWRAASSRLTAPRCCLEQPRSCACAKLRRVAPPAACGFGPSFVTIPSRGWTRLPTCHLHALVPG